MINKSGGTGQLLLLFQWRRLNIVLKATAGTIVGDILLAVLITASLLQSGIVMNRGGRLINCSYFLCAHKCTGSEKQHEFLGGFVNGCKKWIGPHHVYSCIRLPANSVVSATGWFFVKFM